MQASPIPAPDDLQPDPTSPTGFRNARGQFVREGAQEPPRALLEALLGQGQAQPPEMQPPSSATPSPLVQQLLGGAQ